MKRLNMINLGLLPQIVLAIVVGIAMGRFAPMWLARTCATFNVVFGQFLGFVIPLLIVAFVAPAIFEIGKAAGRMLLATALLAYGMTFASGMFSFFVADASFPFLLKTDVMVAAERGVQQIAPFFKLEIQPLMGVMSALVLAFLLGLCLSRMKAVGLKSILLDFRGIINMVIGKVIVPLLPVYIFGIFVNMTVVGEVSAMLRTFANVVAVIFAMHIALLVMQYVIASAFSRKNPFKALWRMMPAYFTALGTQSSAATIPVTLERTVQLGVREDTAGFVIPLCATIHMSGSTLKIVACALAIMLTHSMPYTAADFAGFVAMLGITMVAAPGVPGGAIMAALGLLSSMLGFSEADNALMIALYIAMDSFGTACNVTGDGAIAQIIDRIFSDKANATPIEVRDAE